MVQDYSEAAAREEQKQRIQEVVNNYLIRGYKINIEKEVRNRKGEIVEVLDFPDDLGIDLELRFVVDHRKNAALHALYVKFAISSLLAIDQGIKRLEDECKTTLNGMILAMYKERERLIREDSAFFEAMELFEDLASKTLISKSGVLYIGKVEVS